MKLVDKVFLALAAVLLAHIYFSSRLTCELPYIKSEGGCCIDSNADGVCDTGAEEKTNTSQATIPGTGISVPRGDMSLRDSSTTTTSTTAAMIYTTTTSTTAPTTLPQWAADMLAVCNVTKDEYSRFWCYSRLGVLLNDSSLCDAIERPEHSAAVYCYRQVGIALSNVSLCSMVAVRSDMEDCVREVGKALNRSDLCGLIRHRWDRNDCYSAIALALNDPGLCGRITLESELQLVRDDCYLGVGTAINDSGACGRINHRGRRYQCYKTLAWALNDTRLCGEIKDKDAYEDCMAGS